MTSWQTLGYGDVYPRTFFGKLVGTCTALSGILALALPITVVGANFTQVSPRRRPSTLPPYRNPPPYLLTEALHPTPLQKPSTLPPYSCP